jgi:hypothetical protein
LYNLPLYWIIIPNKFFYYYTLYRVLHIKTNKSKSHGESHTKHVTNIHTKWLSTWRDCTSTFPPTTKTIGTSSTSYFQGIMLIIIIYVQVISMKSLFVILILPCVKHGVHLQQTSFKCLITTCFNRAMETNSKAAATSSQIL